MQMAVMMNKNRFHRTPPICHAFLCCSVIARDMDSRGHVFSLVQSIRDAQTAPQLPWAPVRHEMIQEALEVLEMLVEKGCTPDEANADGFGGINFKWSYGIYLHASSPGFWGIYNTRDLKWQSNRRWGPDEAICNLRDMLLEQSEFIFAMRDRDSPER